MLPVAGVGPQIASIRWTRARIFAHDSGEAVSDAMSDRIMRWTLIGLGVVVLIVAVAVVMNWVAGSNDDDPDLGAVEVGFLQDMIDHHEQALVISNTLLEANPDGDAASYARDVILFQTRDIGRMETWLDDAGYARGSPDREAMVWMGEPTPVATMPGLATPEQIQELADSTGADADRMFFDLMSAHHLGGVHMADYAAAHTEIPWLRDLRRGRVVRPADRSRRVRAGHGALRPQRLTRR